MRNCIMKSRTTIKGKKNLIAFLDNGSCCFHHVKSVVETVKIFYGLGFLKVHCSFVMQWEKKKTKAWEEVPQRSGSTSSGKMYVNVQKSFIANISQCQPRYTHQYITKFDIHKCNWLLIHITCEIRRNDSTHSNIFFM